MTDAELQAELDALPTHEARAVIVADLAKRAAQAAHAALAGAEADVHAAVDRYHAAQDVADRMLTVYLAAASMVGPARERDDAERSEAARRRVA